MSPKSFHNALHILALPFLFMFGMFVGKQTQIRSYLPTTLLATKIILYAQIGNRWKPLNPSSMIPQCPENWSPGCSHVAHFHEIGVHHNLPLTEINIMKRSDGSTQRLPLHIAESANKFGISICIAPMFWYTDWAKLILFVEYWRKQKVEHFWFYVHSSSSDVRKVLDFYQNKGWITIVSWPMLPKSDVFNPNDEIYRLGQVFSHNDCFLRTQTEFTAVVDIDELVHSPKEPLMDFVLRSFEKSGLGSLRFPHHGAVFQPPLLPKPFLFENVDFRGVLNFQYKFKDKLQPKAQEAMLFHIRYNMSLSDTEMRTTNIVNDTQQFQMNLLSAKRAIFPEGASFREDTQIVLGNCTDSWRQTQGNCKAPVTYCRKAVIDMEEWIEETTNVFIVI